MPDYYKGRLKCPKCDCIEFQPENDDPGNEDVHLEVSLEALSLKTDNACSLLL